MWSHKKVRTQFKPYESVEPLLTKITSFVLVGRANVGKSTLFNCLTQTQEALVGNFPGLTRDRLYGLGRIGQTPYLVVDTGGFLGHPDAELKETIQEQADYAIQESDYILMIVDARQGVTSNDQEIVQYLRRFNKPIKLVVNKSENLIASNVQSEFFPLGLGEPYLISATHQQGIQALVKSMVSQSPAEHRPVLEIDSTGIPKVALLGRPNAGKSTFFNYVLKKKRSLVSDQAGTTRDSITAQVRYQGQQYTFIDTAGISRKKIKIDEIEKFSVFKSLQAVHASQVALLLMDATLGITDQDLRLIQFILSAGRALVIAINKWDQLSLDQQISIKNDVKQRLHFLSFVQVVFISALHGTSIKTLFKHINQAYQHAQISLSTSQLNQALQNAIHAHAPPSVKGRAVKLRYAHLGGHHPPTIIIHGKNTPYVPASYKRYLENFYRRYLKSVGTPLRIVFKEKDPSQKTPMK